MSLLEKSVDSGAKSQRAVALTVLVDIAQKVPVCRPGQLCR